MRGPGGSWCLAGLMQSARNHAAMSVCWVWSLLVSLLARSLVAKIGYTFCFLKLATQFLRASDEKKKNHEFKTHNMQDDDLPLPSLGRQLLRRRLAAQYDVPEDHVFLVEPRRKRRRLAPGTERARRTLGQPTHPELFIDKSH